MQLLFPYLLVSALLGTLVLAGPPLQNGERSRHYDLKPLTKNNEAPGLDALLPNSVSPDTYRIKLRPILYPEGSPNEWTAPGSVEILATATTVTNRIVLHRFQTLTINTATVQVLDQNNANIAVAFEDPSDAPTFGILLSTNLVVGQKYTISMEFVAPIGTGASGLYRAYYQDENGVTKRMATTQFESTSARRAFPCFDEPRFNSNFTISLARDTRYNYNTLCNTNQAETGVPDADLPEGWVYDHYTESVKMPTYLVAIVISDFTPEAARSDLFTKPVQVYGAPHLIERGGGKFSAEASARVMANLEQVFTHKYEMPKVDSVAVPRNYFSPGAMENWGLITYRDNLLLYYPGESVETERQSIGSVIVHEQAHQWFGNLVTCKYWSHIWLNEGFATYVAQLGLNNVYPEYEERREFLFDSVQRSMAFDIGPNQPILNLEAELDQQTSSSIIVYDKGGSIIRMMEGFLGFERLIPALTDYLFKYAYQSAEQDELFNTMHEHVKDLIPADKTFKEIMDTWTTQAGFPLIRVSKVDSSRVIISQERYLPVGSSAALNSWEVPLPIVTAESPEFSNHTATIWLTKDTPSITYNHDTSKWILINPDAFGYYRVLYDADLLRLLQEQLRADRTKISGLSRSQLVDDYFSFYNLGHVSITEALESTLFLQGEDDFVVWYAVFNHLLKIHQMFSSQDSNSFKKYLVPKLVSALEIAGWDQGDDLGSSVIYRTKLLDWACALESTECRDHASRLLSSWQTTSKNPVPLDLQPVLYCAIAAYTSDGYTFLSSQFEDLATTPFQKTRLLNALSCASTTESLEDLIEKALDSSSEYGQSTLSIFQGIARNRVGRQLLLEQNELRDQFDRLRTHTGGVTTFRDIVSALSPYVNVIQQRDNLQALIDERRSELSSVINQLNSSMGTIGNNLAWVSSNYPLIDAWFTINAP